MRVMVLGASGMLGHKMVQVLSERYDVWGVARPRIDAERLESVEDAMHAYGPHVVVNCVGQVERSTHTPESMWNVNGRMPHELLAMCQRRSARLVHFSTDCMFDGQRGMYVETDAPSPTDYYGVTKVAGEVDAPALTIRTSMIGREFGTSRGIVEWFLRSREAKVSGYRNAIFSGLTTLALSRLVRDLIADGLPTGLWHVSAGPISKYELLIILRAVYGKEIEIVPTDEPRIDRSLDSSAFRSRFGWEPQTWVQMVAEMESDQP